MDQIIKPREILKKNRLRSTGCRRAVLKKFMTSSHALSHPDLEKSLNNQFDRVTIYRTLSSFLEKGIIHKIPDDTGGVKYALCSEECVSEFHTDNHVHFKCIKCGVTQCIDQSRIPSITLPEHFTVTEVNLLVSGICDKCNG